MKTHQKGFSTVAIIIVIGIVGLLAAAGWFVYNRQNSKTNNKEATAQTSRQETSKNQTAKKDKPDTSNASKPDSNAGYLVFKEWGVKIKMKDADKVSYDYSAKVYKDEKGAADSVASLKVKPEYLQDKSCDVSVGWTRYTSLSDEFYVKLAKKIGNYYFISGGSPYNCGNDADNALNNSIRADFGNLEAL